jgi:asparagine synthase (glutamine-hydrolysing)
MCGIAGFFAPSQSQGEFIKDIACDMVRRLAHRGPDDEGVWSEHSLGLALAHRRLAILDLSSAGHQPMLSQCGRFVVVFNGEIYNHLAIRQELDQTSLSASSWRGHSDTETLLTAVAAWGLERTLKMAVGMFAFVLWDREEKALYLARDRVGEKPLYYGLHKGSLLFASELKSIRAYPGFHGEVDRDALALFLRSNVIPAPHSIYRGILKLPPGTLLKVTQENILNCVLGTPKPYWSMLEVAINGQDNSFKGSAVDATIELDRLLKQSISGQMLADVPVGTFLSGGIDSSTVAALMQSQSIRPVKTFTIGFHESGYDEAQHARAVATHLGTEHTELYLTPEQVLAIIPRLPKLYDEPFADVSQIPTFLVSELAQRNVKVCLSGDGGDELFGGYNRYTVGARLWCKLGGLPKTVRACMSAGISATGPSTWDYCFNKFGSLLPPGWRVRTPGIKLQKIAEMLKASSPEEVYLGLVSHWSNSEQVVIGGKVFASPLQNRLSASLMPEFELEHQMMYFDAITYLHDDILVKLDRASMGVSLETRVPMLDHRVVEFAWRLPLEMKINNHEGKWLLRQVLDRYVPRSLIERPKTGFSVPLDSWLRGPLRDWAEELLNPEILKQQGFFAHEPIRAKWKEHLEEKRDWSSQLWSVLMFQVWLNSEREN